MEAHRLEHEVQTCDERRNLLLAELLQHLVWPDLSDAPQLYWLPTGRVAVVAGWKNFAFLFSSDDSATPASVGVQPEQNVELHAHVQALYDVQQVLGTAFAH